MIRIFAAMALVALSCAGPAMAVQPGEITQAGPFTQAASGAVFPEQVGAFSRLSIRQYDKAGDDVSATYNLSAPQGRLVITVYVYRAHSPEGVSATSSAAAKAAYCNLMFDSARAPILEKPGVREIGQGEAPRIGDLPPAHRKRALFTSRTRFDGAEQDIRSGLDLYCFVEGDWLVKYRASSHAAFDGTTAIPDFIRTGPWPRRN
jgi:hypothetical protein